jgi:hypothetical protein
MKLKKKWMAAMAALAFLAAACPSNNSGGDEEPEDPETTGTQVERPDITKLNKNGQPVRNYVYIEVIGSDPRVALSYKMKDSGKPFFDYVVLFAGTVRDRNCATEPNTSTTPPEYVNGKNTHNCEKQGLHVHWDANIDHVLQNRNKYLKPLQDKGIKVLLCLMGDWSGVDLSTLGSWPYESVSPVAGPGHPGEQGGLGSAPPASWQKNGVPHYPYGPEERRLWLEELKGELDRYQLDGIDFDDEWGNGGPQEYLMLSNAYNPYGHNYPAYNYGSSVSALAESIKKRNLAELVVDAREVLGPDKIITVYEYGGGRYMPAQIQWRGNTVNVADYFNYTANPFYGTFQTSSTTPDSKFSPLSIDIGGGDDPKARPRISEEASGLKSRVRQVLDGNYGAICYYSLVDQTCYNGLNSTADRNSFFTFNGTKYKPEEYLSIIGQELYGEDVIYSGRNYPQDWTSVSHW